MTMQPWQHPPKLRNNFFLFKDPYLLLAIVIPFVCAATAFPFYCSVRGAVNDIPGSIFLNYETGTSTIGSADSATTLMGRMASYTSGQITPIKFTFSDVNGDSLPDFLFSSKKHIHQCLSPVLRDFLDNGNNNFNLTYKCVYRYNGQWNNYGDCATTAPARDPNAPANQNMLAAVLNLIDYYSASSPAENPPSLLHLWIDINGDGL
jgi:hypothetical protein